MAVRPLYIATNNLDSPFIKEDITFKWVKGQSYKQKCLRRESLHEEIAKKYDKTKLLEISTKSDKELGVKLSALKLLLYYCKEIKSVEEIYQNSKVYDNNNHITLFKYKDIEFPNYPIGMYYDYLYMCALYQHNDLREELFNYDYFTDIEFNPNKSKNTQARAAAIFKTLEYNNETRSLLLHMKDFQDYYKATCNKYI